MSITLGLHKTNEVRVYKLSSPNVAVTETKEFLRQKIGLVIFGEFPESEDLISSANKMCLESSDNQAVLWIKDPKAISKVSNAFQVDTIKILAATFKRNSIQVAYAIQRNPSNSRDRISEPEMSFAFEAALTVSGPVS